MEAQSALALQEALGDTDSLALARNGQVTGDALPRGCRRA